jgi:hypothetical protein
MPTPNFNYYPPAGSVLNQTDPSITWDGTKWMRGGSLAPVFSNHNLIGVGPLQGWWYDWGQRAWMKPDAPAMTPIAASIPVGSAGPIMIPPPGAGLFGTTGTPTVFEALIKHPVAPVVGGLLLLASHFTDEPSPPQIPADLPDAVSKQWQMIFNQNQQRYQRRMEMYETLGMVLLGYAQTTSLLEALPRRAS